MQQSFDRITNLKLLTNAYILIIPLSFSLSTHANAARSFGLIICTFI